MTAAERAATSRRQQESAQEQAAHQAEADAIRQELTQARKDADNARREAVAATSRTTALEGKVAQRHLAPSQRQTLIEALRPFAGEKISVFISVGDHESQVFAADFVSVFREAGWDAGTNDGINQAIGSGPVTYGPQVTINAADADVGRYPRGFEAVAGTLIHLGLASRGYKNPQVPSGAIELRVGPKAP